jgi:4-diphosphocytidyl-2-C-methyl-D-erythritol kinase
MALRAGNAASLVVLAPAKINLGLEVLGKRPDGYHEVVTILQALRLSDRVELTPLLSPGILLTVEPRRLDLGPPEENLAVRAARLLPPRAGQPPGLAIRLAKRIPVGAGLGGGSADAAAVLVGLNLIRAAGHSPEGLEKLAASLGADVPFFIRGGTQLGIGRGDTLRPAPAWPSHRVVLVFPRRSLSTRTVYQRRDLALTPPGPLSRIATSGFPSGFWTRQALTLRNDLELAVAELEPAVAEILREFRRSGSSFASVTGSGSGVFALAPHAEEAAVWVQRFQGMGFWSRVVRPSRGGCVTRKSTNLPWAERLGGR